MQGDWGTVISEGSGELGCGWKVDISDARRLRLPRIIASWRERSFRQRDGSEKGESWAREGGGRKSGSLLVCESMLSRVLTFSKPVELRSLRRAAVSGSGQSARFTNSNLASATPSFGWEVVRRRVARAVGDVGMYAGLSSDSLNSWRDSATFRRMPAVGSGGDGQWSEEEEEEEAE